MQGGCHNPHQTFNTMLFVTVGNGKFEELVKEIDRLKSTGVIKDDVLIQLGHGEYKPQHCNWFTFEAPLTKYEQQADVIISHGGPGCIFEILKMGKKLIGIPNRNRTDPRHQVEFLQAIAQETDGLLYCDTPQQLAECIQKAETHNFASYSPTPHTIHEEIHSFLAKTKTRKTKRE